MSSPKVLILGCGFTGQRVARKLAGMGMEVLCTSRNGSAVEEAAATLKLEVNDPASFAMLRAHLLPGMLVLHSIPSTKHGERLVDETAAICLALEESHPARVVYLSTTGVYGETRFVDEHTPTAPRTERELLRANAEQAIAGGSWSSLILRPAAIYGPGRGVHAAVRAGTFRVPLDGKRMTSRIHVDDLAEHAARALLSDLTGSYPVADEEPCSSLDVARFSAELLGMPLPAAAPTNALSETRQTDRRVDSSGIRRALRISLKYPSYRQGIPACLQAEAQQNSGPTRSS